MKTFMHVLIALALASAGVAVTRMVLHGPSHMGFASLFFAGSAIVTCFYMLARPVPMRRQIQFTGNNFYEVLRFLGRSGLLEEGLNDLLNTDRPVVPTKSGDIVAVPGDWISTTDTEGCFSVEHDGGQ